MTAEQAALHKAEIDKLTHEQMCRLHRFAPIGHPYFQHGEHGVYEHFAARLESLGGLSSKMSKKIGW